MNDLPVLTRRYQDTGRRQYWEEQRCYWNSGRKNNDFNCTLKERFTTVRKAFEREFRKEMAQHRIAQKPPKSILLIRMSHGKTHK
jgi:hypothetical protein